ncbi:PRKAB2 [Branchiostoma lanceolatum]|uniref:5'-AMP-activated protein kinase subunit beta-1 n=1 Tax=Branchiostoma lanceolatum TaxID=7740 RepID=A0A8J9Z590_BRALA|nr:PRKAB2 [Branchiostoma lanceolatum]
MCLLLKLCSNLFSSDQTARTKMADRTKKFSPLTTLESSASVKAGVVDTVPVNFVLSSKGKTGSDVIILGSWDDWSQSRRLENKLDMLQTCLDLPRGDYEYKFKMGKTWFCDTTKPVVPNVFGTLNNYLEVTGGDSATSGPEINKVARFDVECLQQTLVKVSEEKDKAKKAGESDIGKRDDEIPLTDIAEQTMYGDSESTNDVARQVIIQDSLMSICMTPEIPPFSSKQTETFEDRVEKTGQSDIGEEDVKMSATCVEELTMSEDNDSTTTQQVIIQDSLMSICMTPEMPPLTSKQTTNEEKVAEEKISRGRNRDEPVICICRKPVPIPVISERKPDILQGTTSKDVDGTKDAANIETTAQVEIAAEAAEDADKNLPKSLAQQAVEAADLLEEKTESFIEANVDSAEQTVVDITRETEKEAQIEMESTAEGQQKVVSDTVERSDDGSFEILSSTTTVVIKNVETLECKAPTEISSQTGKIEDTVPEKSEEKASTKAPPQSETVEKVVAEGAENKSPIQVPSLKDTLGKAVFDIHSLTKIKEPQEPTKMAETITLDAEKESTVTAVPDNVEKLEDKTVTEEVMQDKTATEAVSKEMEVTSDEIVDDKVSPSTPVKAKDESDLKPVPKPEIAIQPSGGQAAEEESLLVDEKVKMPVARDIVEKANIEEASTEATPEDKKVEKVARDISKKSDEKLPTEATEKPEVDIVDKSEDRTSPETAQLEETVEEAVLDIVVQSVDEAVVKAAPVTHEKSERNITIEVTATQTPPALCTVKASEEKDATEAPTHDKTIQVAATDEVTASEIQQPEETPGEAIADTIHEVSPDIAEKVEGEVTKTSPNFGPTATNAPDIIEEVEEKTVTKEPPTDKLAATVAPGSGKKTYAQAVKDSLQKVEDTVPEEVEASKEEESHVEIRPEDKTVEKTASEKSEVAREEVDAETPLTDKKVEETVLQNAEVSKDAVHTVAPSEETTVGKTLTPAVEVSKQEIITEIPPKDKTVEETVSDKVEIPKEEIQTGTTPVQEKAEMIGPLAVEAEAESVKEVMSENVEVEVPKEEVHTETEDKTIEEVVSESLEVSKEVIHTKTLTGDKTIEETVQPQNVEDSKLESTIETPPSNKGVEETVSQTVEVSKEDTHTEIKLDNKVVEVAVQQKVEVSKEETLTETQPEDKIVEETVPQKVEVSKDEIHTETPIEDKKVETTVPNQQVEGTKEEARIETQQEYKTIEEKLPQTVEVLTKEICTDTQPEDKVVEETVPQKVEVSKDEIHTETPIEDNTDHQETVPKQLVEETKEEASIETQQEDKTVEVTLPQTVEILKEEIHTETPPKGVKIVEETVLQQKLEVSACEILPEDKTVEETMQPNQVEAPNEEAHIETQKEDKVVEVPASEKVEMSKEEIHTKTPPTDKTVEKTAPHEMEPCFKTIYEILAEDTETPSEDKTVKKTVQPQNVDISEEKVQSETPPPDTSVEKKVSEKVDVPKAEIHTEAKPTDKTIENTASHKVEPCFKTINEILTEDTETPAEDKAVKKAAQPQKDEVPKEEIHTETPPENKTVERTAPHKVEPCFKTIHEILTEDTSEKIPLFEYTQFTLVCKGEVRGDVSVQGSWDGWKESFKLNKSEDGSYSESVMLPYGLHEYKYLIGNTWIHDETMPAVCNVFGTINNVLKVPSDEGGKESIELPSEEETEPEECTRVRLDWTGEASGDVFVSGSWDGWTRAWKLKTRGDSEYSVSLILPCRQHQYKLRTGNTWFVDMTKPTVPNSFGTFNNTIEVAAAPAKMAKPWGKRKLTDY